MPDRVSVANRIIAVILVLSLLPGTAFAQCAMCKTALTASAEGSKMAAGFNYGILLLLAAPYALVGTIAFLIFNAQRRRKQISR